MADKVPLAHENRDRVVRGIRGLNRMTQVGDTATLLWT